MNKLSFADRIKISLVRDILTLSQNTGYEKFANTEDLPVYDNVETQFNIPYINREEVPLALDVFKPKVEKGTKLPVVVTIHGGGLTMGDRKLSRPFGRLLAHKGYLTFSIEYRLVPQANLSQELEDICDGLGKIESMLDDYDVDLNRVFIAAESAGALLAMHIAATLNSVKLQELVNYQTGKLKFKAIGLMSGLLYLNNNDPCAWILKDQIYGNRRVNETFLELMDPENPEILNHLPPVYLITSRGDFVNSYSIKMNEALKKAGKPCHLLYYGDYNLKHAFTTTQLNNPKSILAVTKMLDWFEEQAQIEINNTKNAKKIEALKLKQQEKIADGSMDDQPIWKYIQERGKADTDRMSAPAIIDCTRTYTYAQMFEIWNQYAGVFSALDITGANRSRVAIAGAITAEPLFAFYALNITGAEVSMFSYPDFLPGGRWKAMIQKEHITDLLITDVMVTPQVWYEIKAEGEKLGLRNIILVHSLMGGPCVGPAELTFNEFNYHALKRIEGTVFLDDLLKKYKDTPIKYGKNTGDSLALITHTSGSTNGTRKPLPYTNRAVNAVASAIKDGYSAKFLDRMQDDHRPRTTLSFDMSSFANIGGLANMNLASGKTIVLTFFGFMHPKFVRAIPYYKVDMVLASSFMVDSWMKLSDSNELDFSDLKVIGVGGSFVSLEKMKQYNEFLKKHGFKYSITRGYGMSEIGGCELYVPQDCADDILGYPIPPEDYYVLDDEDGAFHCVKEGERTGILYATSKSMCSNTLDGVQLFPLTQIDGRDFICTNDKVRVNKDGSLSYAGRMDKFFVNNEGIRFESGIVEKKISELTCVSQVAVVPVLDKRIHDTVPVLFVVPNTSNSEASAMIAGQIEKSYKEDKNLIGTALPSQLVLTASIPCTSSGKVDSFRISRERCSGTTYNIVPVYNPDGSLKSVEMEFEQNASNIKAGSLPNGMGQDSAMGLFDVFNTSGPSLLPTIKDFKKAAKKEKQFRAEQQENIQKMFSQIKQEIIKNIPEDVAQKIGIQDGKFTKPTQEVINKFMDFQGLLYKQDKTNKDFEE